MSLRIVLLSDHGAHGQRLARHLAARGVPLHAVVVALPKDAPPRYRGVWKHPLGWALRRRLGFERATKPIYAPLKCRVLPTGAVNSEAMIARMRQLSPDCILVGMGKILKPPLIEVARRGVFNVHPALLPWVRGSGVPGHSLEHHIALGATLHFIDAGIDTGALIERRLLPVSEATNTLAALESAAFELAAQMMAEAAFRIAQTDQMPRATPQTARFGLFRFPNFEGRHAHDELAQTGRARALFERWQGVSSGAPDYLLPPEMMDAP